MIEVYDVWGANRFGQPDGGGPRDRPRRSAVQRYALAPWARPPPPSSANVPSGPAGAGRLNARTGDLLARHTVDRLGRVREGQHRERDQVAVDLERVQVDVLEGVARLVVARVELLAGGAAPDRLLLLGLDLLGAGEEAARRDAGQDERLVVAAAGELRVVVRLTDRGVVATRRRPRSPRSPAGSGTGASNVDSSAS